MASHYMTSQQFPDLLRVGLRKVFLNEYKDYPEIYSRIFRVQDSNKAFEEELVLAGFGLIPEWNSDGQELPTDQIISGSRVLYVHKDYGMVWNISRRLLREDLYAKVGSELMREAVRAMKQTVETVAHSIINNGFGGSRPLFSDTQPLIGGGTFDNRLTVALTPTGLADALTTFRRWRNHRNQPVMMEPEVLLVPPELEFTAKTILNSAYFPNMTTFGSFGNNTMAENVLQGAVKTLVVSPYLSDTNNWFLFADKATLKLNFFWREKPATDVQTDFRTKGVLHSIIASFSVGFTDWSGCLGSEVA